MFYNLHTHHSETGKNIILIRDIGLNNPGKSDKRFFYSAGIHPWYIREKEITRDLKILHHIAGQKNIIALGECGLDKVSEVNFSIQERVFQEEIHISEKLKKPLIIHCVKAIDELIYWKKQMKPFQKWIIHGFRGNPRQMHQLVEWDFYLSFGFHYNKETVKKIPSSKMFLETDDNTGSIVEVYKKIAVERGISQEQLIKDLTFNFTSLFGAI